MGRGLNRAMCFFWAAALASEFARADRQSLFVYLMNVACITAMLFVNATNGWKSQDRK